MGKKVGTLLASALLGGLLILSACGGGDNPSSSSSINNTSESSIDSFESRDHQHIYGEWEISLEATCVSAGKRIRECETCGHLEEEVIDPLGHDMKLFPGQEPSCITEGRRDYYQCNRCHLYFLDEEGKMEINGPDDEKLHLDKASHSLVDATFDYYAHEGRCKDCNEKLSGLHAFNNSNTCSICGYTLPITIDTDVEGIDFYIFKGGNASVTIDFSLFQEEELILPAYCFEDGESGYLYEVNFTNLTSAKTKRIVLPNSVEYYGSLSGMESLEYISFGSKVAEISGGMFDGCLNLKEVDLTYATSLLRIWDRAFANSGIIEFVVPSSVVRLGEEAFDNCQNLTKVEFLGDKITRLEDGYSRTALH